MPVNESKGLLIDTTLCVGCGACYEACKEANKLPETSEDFLQDKLSDTTFTVIEDQGDRYVRRMCMHCIDPTCVSVCPVGAFEKTALGPVKYHADRCMGCRYCMQACPFGIPRYEWASTRPLVRKCTMCSDRVEAGGQPACAEACPAEATIFASRSELVEIARARMEESPDQYFSHIFGLNDIGGTSVMMISDVPVAQLGYPANLGTDPLPSLTWQVLNKIPNISVFAGVALAGLWWITNRRDEVRRAEQQEAEVRHVDYQARP